MDENNLPERLQPFLIRSKKQNLLTLLGKHVLGLRSFIWVDDFFLLFLDCSAWTGDDY